MKLLTYSMIMVVLLGFGCSDSKKSCAEFRQGKFLYLHREENRFNEKDFAIRTSDRQTYIDTEEGDTLIYDVKWTSDCGYELIFKSSNVENEGPVKIGDTILVSIEPIDDSTFKYFSKSKRNKSEFHGTMKRVD